MFKCKDENCNCTIFHEEQLKKVKSNLISDQKVANIVNVVKLINTENKVKILEAIKEDELCVCDLGHLVGMSKSAISHQMKQFKQFGLLDERKEGKMVYYKLKDNHQISNIITKIGAYK